MSYGYDYWRNLAQNNRPQSLTDYTRGLDLQQSYQRVFVREMTPWDLGLEASDAPYSFWLGKTQP